MLHGRGEDGVAAVEAARTRFGRRADVFAPQAARPCNPFQSNLRDAGSYAGWSWYLGDDPERPEAASFGDVLAELEAFVTGLSRPCVLAGCGQGAVLALTLALHGLPAVVGVWCEGNGLAKIEGWSPPPVSLDGAEVVLQGLDEAQLAASRDAVELRGGRLHDSACTAERWLEALAAAGKRA